MITKGKAFFLNKTSDIPNWNMLTRGVYEFYLCRGLSLPKG